MLSNVTIIRVVLIFLLVFYHAFAIYSGAWTPIDGYPEVPVYWWLDKLSYAFMLEMFVFISGYVFGFQVRKKGSDKLKAKSLLWGKFKRLMIPCVVFSLLYILLFKDISQPIHKTIYDLLNGVGHMWFLPMLFWCFVGVWFIETVHLKTKWVLPICVVLSLCSFLPLPFQLTATMYYFLFFYVGYILQRTDISLEKLYTNKNVIFSIIAFCIIFPILTLTKEHVGDMLMKMGGNQYITKILNCSLRNAMQLIYSSCGIIMILSIVGKLEHMRATPSWMVKMAPLCFGVYLIQQFILKGIYIYTNLPSVLGYYWLPWVGFTMALVGSVVISFFLLKTKIGKSLIG